jgi:putative transposase
VKISGTTHYRWRAVGLHGTCPTHSRGNALAAKHFRAAGDVTDKPAGYEVVRRVLLPSVQNGRSRYLNNRSENSRQDRIRERVMKRYASPG